MLGRLGVNVADLAAAKRYYDELMPQLGFTEFVSSDDEFAYRPAGGKPAGYLSVLPSGGGAIHALTAPDGAAALGSTRGASCWKPSATTTETDRRPNTS